MAEHHDEQSGGAPRPAERARLRRRLHEIAAALNVPVASFFAPAEGEKPKARTDEQPQQADAAPSKT